MKKSRAKDKLPSLFWPEKKAVYHVDIAPAEPVQWPRRALNEHQRRLYEGVKKLHRTFMQREVRDMGGDLFTMRTTSFPATSISTPPSRTG